MSEEFKAPDDPAERLVAAGLEWRALVNAEGEMARLDGYRRMSADMRADRHRHADRARVARMRLHRLLSD
jgi:hypothetical protein